MASCNNSIKINSDVNTVNIQPDNNRITVVNPDGCSVNVTQPITNVIQVATPGITGPIGLTGPSGSVGPSGSFDTSSFVTTSSFNSFTSSIQSEVNSLTSATSSYVSNSQTGSFTTTSSFNAFTGSINSFTSSIQSEVDSLTSVTGSFTTTSSFNSFTSSINSFTSSIQSEVDSLTLQTGSYATTGSNNFVGNQVITGSLTVSGSSTFTNIGPAVFTGTSTFTNITASGNISSSGNIIANQIDTTQITGNPSTVTLGYIDSSNYIEIQNGGDFFINGQDGVIEMYGQGADLYIGDDITLQGNVIASSHITASGNISSSGNIIANQIDTSHITTNTYQVTLGYNGSNNIIIENGADLFINAPDGQIEAIGSSNTQLLIGNTIQLKGSGSSPGITVAASSINLYQHVTASGNISSSGTITGTTGSFNHIIGTVANVIWTIDFTDGELSTRLYAPYNLSIDSVTNITGSPTTSITSSGSPYTLGNAITIGTAIDVTSSISSVINLNITR
jgi:trimeric autotransporter adhesin